MGEQLRLFDPDEYATESELADIRKGTVTPAETGESELDVEDVAQIEPIVLPGQLQMFRTLGK